MGVGQGHGPNSHCGPVPPEVLMSTMEEEVASARAHQSQLDLFHGPILHRINGEGRHPCLFSWVHGCRGEGE